MNNNYNREPIVEALKNISTKITAIREELRYGDFSMSDKTDMVCQMNRLMAEEACLTAKLSANMMA